MRTGVTVIVPGARRPLASSRLPPGCHRLNGNGELTGLEWIRESGLLTTCIGLTNTHSVGVVRDALIAAAVAGTAAGRDALVPAGRRRDLRRRPERHQRHARARRARPRSAGRGRAADAVAEGGVGSGTGMICHGFKGGIGTSSRVGRRPHGRRARAGQPRRARAPGRERRPRRQADRRRRGARSARRPARRAAARSSSSSPPTRRSCPASARRLAQRSALGVGRTGGAGENGSGDLMLAFATGNRGLRPLADDSVASEPVATARGTCGRARRASSTPWSRRPRRRS